LPAFFINFLSFLFFGFQKTFQLPRDGGFGFNGGVAEERGENADEVIERLHFGPIKTAAFGEALKAKREFARVFFRHPACAAVIAFDFIFGDGPSAFPTGVHGLLLLLLCFSVIFPVKSMSAYRVQPSLRDLAEFSVHPALKRRAIFNRPFGTPDRRARIVSVDFDVTG
jgi:hypothetical protein